MDTQGEPHRRVTVVGGGFSGAIFAHHLLRLSPVPILIDIVEERPLLGAGVAYSADEPHQTTNIPSPRMSVYADDPTHFERWLARTEPAGSEASEPYPRRSLFGAYMCDLLDGTRPAHPGSHLRHRRIRVASIRREGRFLTIGADDGTAWDADAAVLATGNPTPVPPPALARLSRDPRVILDPWRPGTLDPVRADDRILIIGIGLSMGEAVAGLAAAGHRGPITAIARRGRRTARGVVAAPPPFVAFTDSRPHSAVGLLRQFRAEVRRAEATGLTWRSVVAAARAQAWDLWGALPAVERRRFVRHLRPWYEALRHVMPGPVYDLLRAEEASGRLRIVTASLRDLRVHADGIEASLHPRHAPAGHVERAAFDAVINCTGPAYATLTETDPFWAGLAKAGVVQADRVGLGIAVDRHGRAISADGSAQDDVLVLGTLARGTYGELTGVAELSRQAQDAAATLVASLKATGSSAQRVDEALGSH